MLKWLVARFSEGSSWRGLVWLLTAFGVTFRPEVWEQITAVGMAAAGLIGVLTSEEARPVNVQLPPIDLVSTHIQEKEAGQTRNTRFPDVHADHYPTYERLGESSVVPPNDGTEQSGFGDR